MWSTVKLKKFLEEGEKIEHSIKSSLGRINKTLQKVDEYLSTYE